MLEFSSKKSGARFDLIFESRRTFANRPLIFEYHCKSMKHKLNQEEKSLESSIKKNEY
ncbi:hypothetical protein LEP1GSC043_4400 [Leptospira weilii str. Ecochallenge]|uniref:Uncharacterized protein n=1 Tax=Leptospira weilii str. Ecochallenge TaxID=1049986 RepID=N1U3H4_9LEPT|nr:hypothetical protein LEP1GSC043_4400 [Leptospira weilii str. Ecochallenge]